MPSSTRVRRTAGISLVGPAELGWIELGSEFLQSSDLLSHLLFSRPSFEEETMVVTAIVAVLAGSLAAGLIG